MIRPRTSRWPPTRSQAKRKQIDDLLKRVRAGEDFATLAKQYSEDPGSKDNGGDAAGIPARPDGARIRGRRLLADQQPGQRRDSTAYGYHIIKLLDKTPAKKIDLTDMLPMSHTTVAEI